MDVYPAHVDYYTVLMYLLNEIKEHPLNSSDINSILESEFGIMPQTPEDIQKYVLSDLREWVRTTTRSGQTVYYRDPSQLEGYGSKAGN